MKRYLTALLLVLLAGCGTNPPPNPNPDPKPDPGAAFQFTVVTKDETGKPVAAAIVNVNAQTTRTNSNGFGELKLLKGSYSVTATADGYRPAEILSLSVERNIHRDMVLARDVVPMTKLNVEGRFYVNGQGTYRPRWTSGLALLSRPPPDRTAFLDEAKALGFDGVRVFAGDLGWAGQTPASALANIPALLGEVHSRGMYTYLVAITGSASGYNVEQYLHQVAVECVKVVSCVLEVANEIGHSSQSSLVNDPRQLESIAKRVVPSELTYALGAMLGQDEVDQNGIYPPNGSATVNTAHLDRGRTPWPEMIRRVREIAGISENTNKPAMSGEPIGAAEVDSPGRRSADPDLFFTYGALCRMFEVGCVFHSEDGLQGRLLGPIQKECAKQFIEGWKAVATDARLTYQNTGWAGPDAPIAAMSGATRTYSGININDGYTVVVGDEGVQIQWKNGWAPVGEPVRRDGAQVIHIRR